MHQVVNCESTSKGWFVRNPSAPADIAGLTGCDWWKSSSSHHAADAEKAFGGHPEPDAAAVTFAVVTLGPVVDLRRVESSVQQT